MSKEFTVFAYGTCLDKSLWYDHCTSLLLKNRKSDRIGLVLGTETHFRDDQFTYDDFKVYSCALEAYTDNTLSVAAAAELFRPKIHLKFTRNLILVTKDKPHIDFSSEQFLATAGVSIYIVSPHDPGCHTWIPISSIDVSRTSSLKKTVERAQYTGVLRFGRNPDAFDNKIRPEGALNIDVQLFAAAKVEPFPSAHEYVVRDGQAVPVKRETRYYIKRYEKAGSQDPESDSEEPFTKEYVPGYIRGFKYSKRDEVALSDEIASVARFPSTPGMDIFGFIKKDSFPHMFLMSEAQYVVPFGNSMGNKLAYKALAHALVDLDAYALVRYVHSQDSDVANCVLMPQKLAALDPGNVTYGLFLVHIPYKEDEKMGRFPPLKEAPKCELMEQFIKSRDLGPEGPVLSHPKLHLGQTEPLNLPRKRRPEDSPLAVSSPAVAKLNKYLKRVLERSVGHESLVKYTSGNVVPELAGENLISLANAFRIDGDVDVTFGKESSELAKRLVEDLGVEYKVPEKRKKEEVKEEVKLGGFLDIDELLG